MSLEIPDDWLDKTIDCHISWWQEGRKFTVRLHRRYIKPKFFKPDSIEIETLYSEEGDIGAKIGAQKDAEKTNMYGRVKALKEALDEKLNKVKKIDNDWRKRATDALVSSNMTEKDKFISDWLEEFKN